MGTVYHGTGTLLFDGGESLLAGEGGVTVQGVLGNVRFENILVQTGHVVEGEVVADMVEVLMEEEVVEEE